MASSVGFHENETLLKAETKDRHRALASLMEELEAIDWYDQRVDAAGDPELKAILAHNRDEEREHAMMCWNGCAGTRRPPLRPGEPDLPRPFAPSGRAARLRRGQGEEEIDS